MNRRHFNLTTVMLFDLRNLVILILILTKIMLIPQQQWFVGFVQTFLFSIIIQMIPNGTNWTTAMRWQNLIANRNNHYSLKLKILNSLHEYVVHKNIFKTLCKTNSVLKKHLFQKKINSPKKIMASKNICKHKRKIWIIWRNIANIGEKYHAIYFVIPF